MPTLMSISKQTLVPFEIIIIDDGSKDATAKIAKQAMKNLNLAGRVISIPNAGPDYARDFAIKQAKGIFYENIIFYPTIKTKVSK